MQIKVKGSTVKLVKGDITKLEVDAIVNAANGTLLGGGGVDGAIHQAAGKGLLNACKQVRNNQLQGALLPTGEAVITKGFNLPAEYVIHTVGPVWYGGESYESKRLANCYRNSLKLAYNYDCQSIAFPSISTGIYQYPVDLAANVAMKTIIESLEDYSFDEVVMVLFSEKDYDTYCKELENLYQ
ncbi:O-acetyl-ADP-ribose deacetylase [Oceanobacillus halotolerans]|uniref:O-acetyl-ADP-ribose deacetylase n=1 Tax=Oceanobacillus halotolerans TaxID=2663380 RepID=UPI0013D71D3C|nr:O-acetyl-ADP-ribose deacetylase [Oceanobacillus halotolerans]